MLLEQHGRELAGRVEVEIHARHPGDVLLQPAQVRGQLRAHPGEQLPVDPDALPLHVHQHLDQRHLDLAQQRLRRHLPE